MGNDEDSAEQQQHEWWRENDDTDDVVTQWFQVEMKELRRDIREENYFRMTTMFVS
jgi:hypothetical protein